MAAYRTEARKFKVYLEHIVVPESKEVLKKGGNHVSRTQKPT